MRAFLFVICLIGFGFSGYFLFTELMDGYRPSQLIYIMLLVILLCNSIVGMLITYPGEPFKKRLRLKLIPVKK